MKKKLIVNVLIFQTLFIGVINAQDLSNAVSYLKPINGIEMKGHYQDSQDSDIEHFIKWDIILDDNMIRQLKTVPELDFEMEILLFVDQKNMINAFHQISNRGTFGSGIFRMDGHKLAIEGDMFTDGISTQRFKQSYELTAEGVLVDIFQRWEDDSWIIGHEIHYEIGSSSISEINDPGQGLDIYLASSHEHQGTGLIVKGNTGPMINLKIFSQTGQMLADQMCYMNNYPDSFIPLNNLLPSKQTGMYFVLIQTSNREHSGIKVFLNNSGN